MAEIIELDTTQKRNRNNSLPNSKTNKTAQKKQKLDSSGILDQDNPYNIIPTGSLKVSVTQVFNDSILKTTR